MLLLNSAEGGIDNTTVTTGNSGGDSGRAWTGVTISGSGSLTYSSTYAAHGRLSYHPATTTAGQCFVQWHSTTFSQPGKTMYGQCYVYFPSTPVALPRFVQFTNSSIQNCGGVGISSGNNFTLSDSTNAVGATSSTAIPTNQWMRVEFMVFSDASVGQMELKIFLSPDSTTPDEVITTPATMNTRGSDIASLVIGNFSNTAGVDYYFDDVAVQETGYVGPNRYLSPFYQNSAEGQPNGTGLVVSNSGGASGTPFDVVSLTGTSSITFSTAQAAKGIASYEFISNSAGTALAIFSSGVAGMAGALRYYLYLTALPSNTIDVAAIRNNAAVACKLQMTSAGVLRATNASGTTIGTLSGTLSINTWYRLEMQCIVGVDTSSGTISAQYYLGDSLSPIDSYSSTSVNAGTDPLSDCRIGKYSGSGTFSAYIDDVAYTANRAYIIGPSSPSTSVGWHGA
ncbi:MAG: hypothetical protein WBP12_04640 [Candidatus Saccharimonas sp.]